MKFLRRFLVRLGNFASRRGAESRLREELAEHVALQTEENLRAGMTAAEARREAALKLGAPEAIREQHHGEQSLPFLENLLLDLRFALRMLGKSPGFAAIAIATMAVGVGATTAIFSVVDATLLHPLPYPDPEQLVRLQDDLPGIAAHDVGISIPEFQDLQRSGIFQDVSIYGFGSVNLTGCAQPARIAFRPVTPAYFAALGASAQLGRTFDPHDATPGFNLEVVISNGLWKRAFDGDPQILGKSLRLDNDEYHVVGVMPAGFRDQGRTAEERNTELWAGTGFAAAPAPQPVRNSRLTLEIVARLKPGLTVAAAQSRLDALVASLKKQYPGDYPAQNAWTVRMVPLSESLVGNVRQSLMLLLGAVGLVLLIGCVNVANLLLARASARGREIAVRQALGATRTRLARQLLTESLLLSLAGGIAGVVILLATRKLLLNLVPDTFPHLNDISINWTVMGFALLVSLAAGTIFGLAPAWLTSRLDLTGTLRQEGRGTVGSSQRTGARRALVIGELALSLVLMIAAGLLLRSFWDLFRVQLGFHPEHVMAVQTWLPVPNDPTTDVYGTATQEAPLLREFLRRGRALPGVKEVAVSGLAALPLGHDRNALNAFPLMREDHPVPDGQAPLILTSIVSPEYFHLLGMTLLEGRIFTDQDVESTPAVAVINESAGRTWWPNENPLGKHIKLNASRKDWTTVVGVIADARTEAIADAGVPQVYLTIYQRRAKDLAIFLRGQLDRAAIPEQVREQVQAVNAELPVFGARTLDDLLSDSLSARRFSMEMVALFAGTALLLAALGIYGTISYVVSEQTREIGIRLALGANRGVILNLVLRQGLVLAAAGTVLGLAGALIVSHLMAGLLYGVAPTDLLTFVSVTGALVSVALAASYIPARRAMRVDPLTALRYE
jgi:putative ABC transport system permease protein